MEIQASGDSNLGLLRIQLRGRESSWVQLGYRGLQHRSGTDDPLTHPVPTTIQSPQRTTKHLSSPSTLTPKSLGVLFQALSLGEKNEIRFKRVFMENRFCAQCRLSQESLALGRPWLGWEAALGPLPRVPPRATEGGPWVGLVCSVTP